MLAELFHPLRRRVLAQILGGGADYRAAHGQSAGNQVRVQVVAGADRQVYTLIHQVHRAVEHLQVDADTGVAFDVLGHGVGQLRLTE